MRRMTWIAAIMLSIALVLSACGTKDAESVVKDLDKFINNLQGYSGTGTMTLHSGQTPQSYQVEVSYQAPEKYRIELTNVEKDITQIVLRNDEGVFVLTPKQNKMFRFQSDWPQKQGQVYLYQTLVQSILLDGSRQFTTTDDAYVFDVMAKYNSSSLARQKIWLSQDDYKPLQVEVSDANATVLVDLKFDSFNFNPQFEENFFDTNANMNASAPQSNTSPGNTEQIGTDETTTQTGDEGVVEQEDIESNESIEEENAASEEESDETMGEEHEHITQEQPTSQLTDSLTFTAMEPTYSPTGVTLKDMIDIEYAGNTGVLLRYDGVYTYTLLETEALDTAVALVSGDFIDLGYTIGQLTAGDDIQTLSWTYHGNQYRLSSANLPQSEMIKVAQSVQAQMMK